MAQSSFLLFQLAKEGFCCSQIMVLLDLRQREIENPQLIKALTGLCGGMGGAGKACGALTGGTCLLGLYGGKASADEEKNENLSQAIKDYLAWFEESQGHLDCRDILGEETFEAMGQGVYPVSCGNIMSAAYRKLRELIDEYELDKEK